QSDSALYLGDRDADRGGDRRVLVVYELKYLPRRHRAQVSSAGIARLGLPLHHVPHARRMARRAAPMAGSSRTGSTAAPGNIWRSSPRTARSSEATDSNAPPARSTGPSVIRSPVAP